MNTKIYAVTALSAALFLSGCEGDDGLNGADGTNGTNGADGMDGLNSLVAFRDLPVGDADCIGGGQAFDTGLDTNRNNVLDPDEVQVTEFIECAVTPTLRALHASPDAPKVNILIDDTAVLTDVDFNMGSGFVAVGQGDNVTATGVDVNVQIEGILPGDDAIVLDETFPLAFGFETTVIASGTIEGNDFGRIIVSNPIGEPIADGNFRAQVVHASPSAPPVNVFVTAFDGDLVDPVNGAAPLAFGQSTPQLEVLAGAYQIRVALANGGGAPTVVYDSGEITLDAGADLLIAATENVFLGDSAVQLVVLDGVEASPRLDAATPAAAVAVHLGPDAPAVDILADVFSTPEVELIKLVENVEYTDACVIENIGAPEIYTLNVVTTGDTTSVLPIPYEAEVNTGKTVIVSGLISTDTLQAIELPVEGRSVYTEAKVRLTHGSPSTPPVDIWILPEGGMVGDEGAIVFEDVPFGADTGILSVAVEEPLDVYITLADDTMPQISVTGFIPQPGQAIDVIARDAMGMEPGPQAYIIDYDDLDACVVSN